MKQDYLYTQKYLSAKKKVKKIKGFYFQLIFSIVIIPVIIIVNLKLIEPQYHWFWFGIFGVLFSLLLGWLDNFGFDKLDFDKTWRDRKIKDFMNEQTKYY